jgi:glycosyltransferase involved in cell wall biosynthesis
MDQMIHDQYKIKVLYDHLPFIGTYGGVPRYLCEILKEIHDKIEIERPVLYSDNEYAQQLPFLKIPHLFTKNKFKGKSKLEGIINLGYSSRKIIRNNYDIFHATCSNVYMLGYSNASYLKYVKKPVVATIHDMIYENAPAEYQKTYAIHIESKKKLIYGSDHIIAVSENTKKEILAHYSINPEKITVIHHGAPSVSHVRLKNNFGNYILFVGRRSPYKNFPFFIESIAPLLLDDNQLKLVCVSPSFTIEEEKLLAKLGVGQQIVAIGGVPDEVLNSLYKNALSFVFPSLEEGFGIPILEAFANNCPVCLSNSSCFPEIAGNAALYFDPKDSTSIYDALKRIINDKPLALELSKLGSERLTTFSWEMAANQTLEVYNSVHKSDGIP